MAIYYLLQALKGEPLSSGFSTDGTLIFASAVPHRGDLMQRSPVVSPSIKNNSESKV